MKNAKRVLSLFLSIIMMTSVFASTTTAYSNTISANLPFATTVGGRLSGFNSTSYAYYKFSLQSYTTLKLDFDSTNIETNYGYQKIEIIKASDYNDYTIGKTVNKSFEAYCNGVDDKSWCDATFSLYSGAYYFILSSYGYSYRNWSCDYKLSVTPTVYTIRNLTASSTTNSTRLTWTGDLSAKGYEIQRKTTGNYKSIKTTTGTSCLVKDLTSATAYTYRVRGYNIVNSKKYYGKWKTVSSVTKPNKVTIKTPTTNTKHQITIKWNKMSRVSGYQTQICSNKSCSKVIRTNSVTGYSKTSYTAGNLKKGKTYYVRVRAFKTVNSKRTYGAWSSVKSIKCR
ncbi:MAG: fibronectin type III domain-containing protein [Eubacterium sp.]